MNVRGYGRRSDDDQSAYSPPAQERACKDWARANGHEWKGWFFDDDLSGKREDRPDLPSLLRAADPHDARAILAEVFDVVYLMPHAAMAVRPTHELAPLLRELRLRVHLEWSGWAPSTRPLQLNEFLVV